MSQSLYNEQERDKRKPIKTPLKAIRAHCLECVSGSSKEVELCTDPKCWLYPFRAGSNPFRKPMAPERRKELQRRAKERGLGQRTGLCKKLSDVP